MRGVLSGVLAGGGSLLGTATSQLGGIAPYHYWDFINNRALFASADVGGVASTPGWSYTRADAQTAYAQDSAGNLIPFATGVLRRTDKGVLIEGARTNLCLRSQELDNGSWTPANTTVSANATTAPDGTTTADKIIASAGSAAHLIQQSRTVTISTAYAASVYVKASEYSKFGITENNTSGAYATFNLSGAGSVINTGLGGSGLIRALGSGWYHVTLLYTTGGAQTTYRFDLNPLPDSYTTGAPGASYTGDGTSGIFVWGAQLEAGAFPSSYIPTTTASATRAADVLTVSSPGVSYPLSVFAEVERVVDTGGGEYALTVSNTSANQAVLFVSGATDVARVTVDTASVRQADIVSAATIPLGAARKMAARVSTNSVRLTLSGVLATEDTVATMPTAPITVGFGESPSFGYLRRAAIINSAVNDAGLQAMTTT